MTNEERAQLDAILKYAAARGISIPADVLLDIGRMDAKALLDALKIKMKIRPEDLPLFTLKTPGAVPAPKDGGLVLMSNGWDKLPPRVVWTGGGVNDHSGLKNLDYASAGHTGFQPTITYPFALGTGGNTFVISSTGEVTLTGSATYYDDLRVEPTVRASAGAGVPAFEKWYDDAANTSKGVYLYSFTDEAVLGNEKEIFFTMQMPHGWAFTPIHFHVHWVGAATLALSTPRWGLEYAWQSIGNVYGDSQIIYAIGNVAGDTGVTANKHYLTEFTDLDPGTAANELSSVLIGRLFRSSSNAADTYDGNKCGLLYIDAHIEYNQFGSNSEFIK